MYSRPAALRRQRHRLDVVAAVGRGRVQVEVASQVGALDQRGQRVRARRPRFRPDARAVPAGPAPGRAPCRFPLRPRRRATRRSRRGTGRTRSDAGLGQRPIAQRDVVGLRAGEILQGGAAELGWHQAQVGLQARAEQHAGLRLAPPEDARRRAGSEMNVSITAGGAPTARMSRSPQVSTPRRRLPTGVKSASGYDALRCATSARAPVVDLDARCRPAYACAPRSP